MTLSRREEQIAIPHNLTATGERNIQITFLLLTQPGKQQPRQEPEIRNVGNVNESLSFAK